MFVTRLLPCTCGGRVACGAAVERRFAGDGDGDGDGESVGSGGGSSGCAMRGSAASDAAAPTIKRTRSIMRSGFVARSAIPGDYALWAERNEMMSWRVTTPTC